jgi:hypothetical protein
LPVNGSYFDPRLYGLILAFVAVIIVVWGYERWFDRPLTSRGR